MAKIPLTPNTHIDTEQLLEGVAQLETSELQSFVSQVSFILANRSAQMLPAAETALIQIINQALPANTQRRYDELQQKRRNSALSEQEHQELLDLVDVVEQASAKRLEALIALARLRQVSVDKVMQQLEIQPPTVDV